ncbi:hypothetical protein CBL_01133 [Carabus blaptoides fortunei]
MVRGEVALGGWVLVCITSEKHPVPVCCPNGTIERQTLPNELVNIGTEPRTMLPVFGQQCRPHCHTTIVRKPNEIRRLYSAFQEYSPQLQYDGLDSSVIGYTLLFLPMLAALVATDILDLARKPR